MDLDGSWYRQIVICVCVKNILTTKCDVVGACWHLADCLLHCVPVMD